MIEYFGGQRARGYSFVFQVERLYKGALASEVTVVTGQGHGDCGYRFQVGEQYLVYAGEDGDKRLGTNICTRTTPISRADADLVELGSPKTIFVSVNRLSLIAAGGIALFAFAAGFVTGKKWPPRQTAWNAEAESRTVDAGP